MAEASTKAIEGYTRLCSIIEETIDTNRDALHIEPGRLVTTATLGLWAKARKTAASILALARLGYGEDAFILARSQANLVIDLGYICADKEHMEARAQVWWSRGLVSRHDFLTKTLKLQDGLIRDWDAEQKRAKQWGKIWKRAKRAHLERIYDLAYTHGSSFEHSDSWSIVNYLALEKDARVRIVNVDPQSADIPLHIGAYAYGHVAVCVAFVFGFRFEREAEALALLKDAFNTRPPSAPDSGKDKGGMQ
jgi:hypothetical protein